MLRPILASAATFSGSHGSSNQYSRQGSSSRAIAIAEAGLKRPWQSIMISISGPTASRTASTSCTARRIAG